jgi:hypothetical protein
MWNIRECAMSVNTPIPNPIYTLMLKLVRLNSAETLLDAAAIAESLAAEMETGILPIFSGPEACRYLATTFRRTSATVDHTELASEAEASAHLLAMKRPH